MTQNKLAIALAGPVAMAALLVAPLPPVAAQQPRSPDAARPGAASPAAARARPAASSRAGTAVKSAPGGAGQAPDLAALIEQWVRLPPTAPDRAGKLEYLRQRLGSDMLCDQLALVAADTSEPVLARASALLALGEEDVTELGPFVYAIHDPDATLRAAAAAALQPVMERPSMEPRARPLLVAALRDRVPAVASRALTSLADYDAAALRDYLASGPPAPLVVIARQFLTLAEERGAPLAPLDSTGTLEREAAGVKLEYTPSRRWTRWDLSAGTLSAQRRGGGRAVVLARDVEVARDVLPAAISPDARYVAYESGAHLHVRDLERGRDRDLGPGLAPRSAPLAPGFIFFVPGSTRAARDSTVLSYTVRYAAFAGGATSALGTVETTARMSVSGNASAVRWACVVQGEDGFLVTGDGLRAPLQLPDLAERH